MLRESKRRIILPVPVLAEPVRGGESAAVGTTDEARESTETVRAQPAGKQDSRGGQTLSKEQARKKKWYDKHGAQYMKMYRAAQKLKEKTV